MERLCAALADPKGASGLQKLDLERNQLPPEAGVLLARSLSGHGSLKELKCAARLETKALTADFAVPNSSIRV